MNSIFKDEGFPDWKPVGKSKFFRPLIYADRMLAVVGGIVFGTLYAGCAIIIPTYLFLWICGYNTIAWLDASPFLAVASFICLQCLMAYLREAHFYDSFAIYVFLGGLLMLFLLVVQTVALVSMLYRETIFFDKYQILVAVVLQIVEGFIAMQCA